MAVDEPGQEPDGVQDARLQSLDERLSRAAHAEAVKSAKARGAPSKGYSQGNRVLAELIGGLVGGALLGWLFDRWLGTSPWGLLVMLFAGIGVAFRNIIRISGEPPR